MAGMWLVGEDMPQETNRITLDPKAKDKFACRSRACAFPTTVPTTPRCAIMPKQRRAAVYEAVAPNASPI